MAAKVLSIVNNKGGVGKSTSVIFLGDLLSFFGKKVLLIDMDESGNLSMFYKRFQEDNDNVMNDIEPPLAHNISELFRYRYRTEDELSRVIYNVHERLDIIPSSRRFSLVPDRLLLQSKSNNLNSTNVLKKAVQAIHNNYDYILIDTAPKNDILVVNSLMISDYVVIPVNSEGFSQKGLKESINVLSNLCEEYDLSTQFLGAFQTAAETNTNVYKDLDKDYSALLGAKNLPCIRKDVKVKELLKEENFGSNVIEYTSSSNVLFDYCKLLLAMNILDSSTANLIKAAYPEMDWA